jgi:hypothetical protein
MNKKPVIRWSESKWLVLSSLSILPSSYISYNRHLYLQSYLLLLTTFCSINYWRKPINGIRFNCDLLFSKISFFLFLYEGCLYLNGIGLLCYPNLAYILYFYYKSNILFESNDSTWLYHHIMFHILCGIQGYVITLYLPCINTYMVYDLGI